MTIVERLQRAIDDEPFMLGGEHDLLRDALNEIEIQRGIIERLRADLATQQGCCDGAASQDAHVRQEREEHRAEVERLRAENTRMVTNIERLGAEMKRADLIRAENSRLGSDNRYYRKRYAEMRSENEKLSEELALMKAGFEVAWTAMGGKP